MPIEFEKYEIDVQALMRGLVHELRNPLSAILTASSLLPEMAHLDDENTMLLDVVRKEARRMNRILTEFSTFVKPPTPHLETLDLSALARRVAKIWLHEHPEAVFTLRDELPPTLWATADPNLTEQAFRHLWENAVQAVAGGGEIVLLGDWEDETQRVCLEIDDSGSGLSREALERAFQPFFSNKAAATGLGLSIARMALRASGGDCRIRNGATGACVTLELPIAEAPVAA